MFQDSFALLFRSLNVNLLYVRVGLLEKLLKISFIVSGMIYKQWMKGARTQRWLTLTLDRTIKMKVDVSKAMGAAFYWMGFHELNEWRFLNGFLKPEMVLIDVGANQGEFSLFAAKRLTHGKVYAFEPVNSFYHQLKYNIDANKFANITSFPFGLSDAPATLPVYMGPTGIGENEGLATVFKSEQRNHFIQKIELRVFDEMANFLGLNRLDFIKIDVEGAELMVLKGSRKTIEQYKPVIMLEVNEETYRAAGYSLTDIKSFLASLNYTLYVITKGGKLKIPPAIPAFCNVVCTPND